MSEKLLDNEQAKSAEKIPQSAEVTAYAEKMRDNRETEAKSVEQGNDTDNARHEVEAVTKDREKAEQRVAKHELKKDRPVRGNAASRNLAFKKTMKDAQSEMSTPSRAFSKVIHNKVVEKTSEALGDTVARPNVLLAGSLSALIITTGLYLWARYVGYPLSGFETIAAFIIGYLIGIIFDFTRVMITGKR